MSAWPKFISLTFVLLILTNCASRLELLRQVSNEGNDFYLALAQEYLDFAETEADQYDWWDSRYFAKKGLKAAHGEKVLPEQVDRWDITDDAAPSLIQARKDLMALIADNLTVDTHYKKVARAQFLFDCWIEQQEESWQNSHISYCREEFYKTLDDIYLATIPENRPTIVMAQKEAVQVVKPKPEVIMLQPKTEDYLVYFDLNSSQLNTAAKELIDSILENVEGFASYDITLNAHTDRLGSISYNQKLSEKRAAAVKERLMNGGVDENSIAVFAFGEKYNRIPTKDGVAEKNNRIVEIVIDH